MYLLGEVCAYLQDAEAAGALYPQLVPIADQVATIGIVLGCYGSLHFPAALLASCLRRWEEAERHFEGALATNERLEARPWVVRTPRLGRDAPRPQRPRRPRARRRADRRRPRRGRAIRHGARDRALRSADGALIVVAIDVVTNWAIS